MKLKPKNKPKPLLKDVERNNKHVSQEDLVTPAPLAYKPKKINPLEVMQRRRAQQGALVDRLTKEIEDMGVKMFTPIEMGGQLNIDSDYLTLPKNITDIPSQFLGQYLNAFTQQRMYMRTLIGWQTVVLEEAKRNYYAVSEVRYKELSKTKLSETAKERELNSDPNIKPYFMEYKDQKRKLELLELTLLSIEDAIFLISREVSRRTGDFNTENRTYNVLRR